MQTGPNINPAPMSFGSVVATGLITAAILVFATDLYDSVVRDQKRNASFAKLHTLHTALLNYCDEADGTVASLPYDFAKFVNRAHLPAEVMHTGGEPIKPREPASDLYRIMWPSNMSAPNYNASWSSYVAAAKGNPVLIIDDTFPETEQTGPFVKTTHYGLRWDGSISRREYKGLIQDLTKNWE